MNPSVHKTPRQRARELAFQFLFRFHQEQAIESPLPDLEKDFHEHAIHFSSRDDVLEFSWRLVKTTMAELSSIDSMITKHAANWRLERFGAVDKTFLRMGVAELLYFKDVPVSVTINEVVELSKEFGESDTPLFLNGILDPISKEPLALSGKTPSNS